MTESEIEVTLRESFADLVGQDEIRVEKLGNGVFVVTLIDSDGNERQTIGRLRDARSFVLHEPAPELEPLDRLQVERYKRHLAERAKLIDFDNPRRSVAFDRFQVEIFDDGFDVSDLFFPWTDQHLTWHVLTEKIGVLRHIEEFLLLQGLHWSLVSSYPESLDKPVYTCYLTKVRDVWPTKEGFDPPA